MKRTIVNLDTARSARERELAGVAGQIGYLLVRADDAEFGDRRFVLVADTINNYSDGGQAACSDLARGYGDTLEGVAIELAGLRVR